MVCGEIAARKRVFVSNSVYWLVTTLAGAYPARGRVSAGWRPRSGINNAVPSMAGSLEVVRLGLGWDPLMGRRLGPSADEQRASVVCAHARARCQWRQLANYTGRLHPIADVGHLQLYVGEALNVCYEEGKKEGEEIVFECIITGPKQSVIERSIRCPVWPSVPIPPIPAKREILQQQPDSCSPDHRQLGRCSGLGRTAWGGTCK